LLHERHQADAGPDLAVKVVHVEEQVDGRVLPPHSRLPVALDAPQILFARHHPVRERRQDTLGR
jgi:hypothetical protein